VPGLYTEAGSETHLTVLIPVSMPYPWSLRISPPLALELYRQLDHILRRDLPNDFVSIPFFTLTTTLSIRSS
jgi:hypothetical protein